MTGRETGEQRQHLRIKITGKVQGVFFRASAKQLADSLSITGFARNDPDGSVTIEAEGAKDFLDKFITWCEQGPRHAVVEKITVESGPVQHFDSFVII